MGSKVLLVVAIVLAIIATAYSKPTPDSADLIPLPGPGLAYGGIPYGSVSGQLSAYFGPYQSITSGSGRRSDYNNLQHL